MYRWGCQGFLVEYYPKWNEVWRLWQKPVGLNLYRLILVLLSLWTFFFVGNYFHSKSPCFLGAFFLLTLRTIKTSYLYNKFIFYNHCIKFFCGLLAAGTKATAGNGWENGMGRDWKNVTCGVERMELLMLWGAEVDAWMLSIMERRGSEWGTNVVPGAQWSRNECTDRKRMK